MHPTVRDVLSMLDALGVKRQRLTVDSRSVAEGDVFAALPGSRVDGREFITMAKARGAVAVLREAAESKVSGFDIPVIDVYALTEKLGEIADAFYNEPSARLRVLGITGTNGKTSIANWLAQALTTLGEPCGSVGTLGVSFAGVSSSTQNTTPDAASVHTILRDLGVAGAKAVAMEVSSHALELHRVAGVRFDAAIFTNLTQDHLDFHGTMEAYGAAKARLFTDYPTRHRIINADDLFGAELIARNLPNTVSYGLTAGEVRGTVLKVSATGMRLSIGYRGDQGAVDTQLIGRFNAYNLLAVAATLLARGTPFRQVTDVLSTLSPAPGRMQPVNTESKDSPRVYVDYAHTPDALAKALDTVRETAPTSLSVVFGCGGDRDRSKRPIMGAIAAERADHVYVTSDNPRSEQPEAIIAEIAAGVAAAHQGTLTKITLRREAIQLAIASARDRDAILIAGKGHENYQEINGVRYAFSDVDEARLALNARKAQSPHVRPEGRHVVR